MSVVDFQQTLGAFIDREENKAKGVYKYEGPMTRKTENFTFYMPTEKDLGEILSLNFEVTIRVKTNLKLNLVDKEGNSLVQDPMEKETHYIKFESVANRYPLSFKTVWKLITELGKTNDLTFEDWTITDFDNCLNGNPHIDE